MEVFFSSPWVPVEWIKAHGLEPRAAWSAPEFDQGRLPLSEGVCAFAEAVLRQAEGRADSAVVFTTTCDQLRRSFDALTSPGNSRRFLFNVPATWQSPAARRVFADEVQRLGRFLEHLGGHAPSSDELVQVVARYDTARARLLEAVRQCSARQFAEAVARFHWDGTVTLPTSPTPPPANQIPLALVGGPLPASQWGLLDTLEAAGAQVVLNATETGERSLLPRFSENLHGPADAHEGREPSHRSGDIPVAAPLNLGRQECRPSERRSTESGHALEALVDGYFDHLVEAFQRPNTRLYSWLGERLAVRHARGLVLWHYVGCDLWRAEAQRMREAFGLPVLLLDADETGASSPRCVGRLQAFVELLR